MKTDHPIYLFLSTGAEAFRVLTGGHRLVGEYRFCSLTIKGLERRLDGIFERFRGLTAREIWAMLNLVTPIQETRAYQSIFEEGKTEGEAKGKAEGRASTLKRLLARRFGAVPGWAQRRSGASTRRRWRNWMPGSTGSSMPRVCWP